VIQNEGILEMEKKKKKPRRCKTDMHGCLQKILKMLPVFKINIPDIKLTG
jgi:hypothetical protein